MIKLIAMALSITTAADRALTEAYVGMTYDAARCSVWTDDNGKEWHDSAMAIDPRLDAIWQAGIADTVKGIRHDVCQTILNRDMAEVERLKAAIK